MSCVKHMDFPKHHPFPVLSGLHWSIKALPEKKKHPGEGTFHVVETNVAAFPALQVKAVIKLLWGPAMRFFGINVAHTGEVENIPNQKGQTKTINPKVWLLSWLEILWDPNSSHSGSSQTPSFPSSVSPPYGPVHIALQLPGAPGCVASRKFDGLRSTAGLRKQTLERFKHKKCHQPSVQETLLLRRHVFERHLA